MLDTLDAGPKLDESILNLEVSLKVGIKSLFYFTKASKLCRRASLNILTEVLDLASHLTMLCFQPVVKLVRNSVCKTT